jgi:hypothetical protein
MKMAALNFDRAKFANTGTWVGLISIVAAVALGDVSARAADQGMIAALILSGLAIAGIALYFKPSSEGDAGAAAVTDDTAAVGPSLNLLEMLEAESRRIKSELTAKLDRLIEEFRNTEQRQGMGDGAYETIQDVDYDDIVALANDKNCSPAVAAAALLSLGAEYADAGVLFHPRGKN